LRRLTAGLLSATACLLLVAALAPLAGAKGKPPKYKSDIEIEETSGHDTAMPAPFYAQGGVGSSRRSCRFGRTVELHLVKGGVDTVVGSATSEHQPGTPGGEVEGFWRVDTTTTPGPLTIYAVVLRKATKKAICKSAISEKSSFSA
jgi:hypothetical protein